jgi:hypothetical protein
VTDSRLARKIEQARALAKTRGVNLLGPLLAGFELPSWGSGVAAHEIAELARLPGTAVVAVSPDPLPEAREAVAATPRVHVIAERGLVCGLSGGAVLHVYPGSEQEMASFAVALFAGAAPAGLAVALSGNVSSGRQEAALGVSPGAPPATSRELMRAIRLRDGTASPAEDGGILVDDLPNNLRVVRDAMAADFPRRAFRVSRLASGMFHFGSADAARVPPPEELLAIAQGIAISCDRYLEPRGRTTFGFATEPVARGRYGIGQAAQRLAHELFGAPDAAVTHLGIQPIGGEGTVFFAYEGSEGVFDAEGRGIPCVVVRDFVEYARVLHAIRKGG